MLTFACSHCGLKLQIDPKYAGKQASCPTCKQLFTVPDPSATVGVAPAQNDRPAAAPPPRRNPAAINDTAALAAGPSPASSPVVRAPGTERYRPEAEIARGGMGAVLRATDCIIRREVALKYLLDQGDARKKNRFIEEAQITGQLEHPNIVPIHDLGEDAQMRLFFSMKMVKGRSLAQVLDELRTNPKTAEKEYTLTRLLGILVNICNALAYSHSRGVIHRDLKPANIMIGDFGEVYVMDWGLAKIIDKDAPLSQEAAPILAVPVNAPSSVTANDSGRASGRVATSRDSNSDVTQEGAILGTPSYMPPEQAMGKIDAIDARSDVYALGAILYEMLSLEPPVEREGGYLTILMRVSQGDIKPPEVRAPKRQGKIPRELSAVALKALALKPENRYPSAEALRRDLELFLEGRAVSAKGDTAWETCVKIMKRNKGVTAATAVALVLLAVVLGISFKVIYGAKVEAQEALVQFKQEQEDRRKQGKTSVPAFMAAARLSAQQQRFDDALAQVNVALDFDPDHGPARLFKGQVLLAERNFPAARTELEKYLQAEPKDASAKTLLDLARNSNKDRLPDLLALSEAFAQQKELPLANRVAHHAEGLLQSYKDLLPHYQKRLETAWPGTGRLLGFDGVQTFWLDLNNTKINTLEPIQGMKLKSLHLSNCEKLKDVWPLKGMNLSVLYLDNSPVKDLRPLQGMQLTKLYIRGCPVADLGPLKGMPLEELYFTGPTIADLSPLEGMPLTALHFSSAPITNLAPLKRSRLTNVDLQHCADLKDITPLKGLPITYLSLLATRVEDLTPLKDMPLRSLILGSTPVKDITPLKGAPITKLHLTQTQVDNLKPLRELPKLQELALGTYLHDGIADLRGLKLTLLYLDSSKVKDISFLEEMPLTQLSLRHTEVGDLSPLQKTKLEWLILDGCKHVKDLSPLRQLPITVLSCNGCEQIKDLTPLENLKLTQLQIAGCPQVTDLTTLKKMKLTEINFTPKYVTQGIEVIRQMESLNNICGLSPKDFWQKYDAGEFKK